MCKFYTRIEQPILVTEAMATSAEAITIDVDNKHKRKESLTYFERLTAWTNSLFIKEKLTKSWYMSIFEKWHQG